MTHVNFTPSQNAYRLRADDGNETTATWIADQNEAASIDVSINTPIRVRVLTQETAGGSSNNVDFTIQYQINNDGWNNVNSSTVGVQFRTSSHVTNGTATTTQLTVGSGTFRAGSFISVSDSTARVSFSGDDYTENEWSLELLAADLNHGDVVTFRTLQNGATYTYNEIPTVNVIKTLTGTNIKSWDGAVWIDGELKKWDGAQWVPTNIQRWTGSEWVEE